jgi:hypothetical protein
VVSCLGWGTHALAPLSFKEATYSGVFILPPLLSGEGRKHHHKILDQARQLVESEQLVPILDERRFTLNNMCDAYALSGQARQEASWWSTSLPETLSWAQLVRCVTTPVQALLKSVAPSVGCAIISRKALELMISLGSRA